MSELYEKSLLKLELDRVLELLSSCAGSVGGKEACFKVKPISDLEEVQILLDQTTAASELCTKKGNPVFGDVSDVSASLERANLGGSLQPGGALGGVGVGVDADGHIGVVFSGSEGAQGQHHHQRQQHGNELLHGESSL